MQIQLMQKFVISVLFLIMAGNLFAKEEPVSIAGVYPHLTMYNNENECGSGAIVPWAGSLWAITYAPHEPKGSSDKLYQITPDLN